MKKKLYSKLVRDRIPEIIEEDGKMVGFHVATEEEYQQALLDKLVEEVQEFIADPCLSEMADVCEVLEFIKKEFKLHSAGAEQIAKRVSRGSFKNGYILDWVEE